MTESICLEQLNKIELEGHPCISKWHLLNIFIPVQNHQANFLISRGWGQIAGINAVNNTILHQLLLEGSNFGSQ
jgi:hypothetical protein